MTAPTLITSALPYANGSIHLGHLVEYIQTDILVRFLKMTGRDVVYMCADDTHGTPIEINARRAGITPEELINRYYDEHQRDFADFHIVFDCYYSTNSPENRRHSEYIFERLRQQGHIVTRPVAQYYCEQDERFLPDRFIRGTCPNPQCRAPEQYGDVCEVCGTTYNPTDLQDAHCAICGKAPTDRKFKRHFPPPLPPLASGPPAPAAAARSLPSTQRLLAAAARSEAWRGKARPGQAAQDGGR